MTSEEIRQQSKPFIDDFGKYHPSATIYKEVFACISISTIFSFIAFSLISGQAFVGDALSGWFAIPLLMVSAYGGMMIMWAKNDNDFLAACSLVAAPIIFAFNVWCVL